MWFRGGLEASPLFNGVCDFHFSVWISTALHEQNLPLLRLWLRLQKEQTAQKLGLI
jgi:hypothetical protein